MFHIYVDGSCLGNQNVDSETPAGWGVVVITGSNDLGRGNGEIFHEFNGEVITDSDDSKFIGAEVGSNNTAELTAFAEALRWVLSEGGRFQNCDKNRFEICWKSGHWRLESKGEP